MPLGYLGDPAKTAATFPSIDGVRHAVAGDRARVRADGAIELHGRDSVTINTGGEKVFAEEVEQVLKQHAAVFDTLVVGRPSERWGQEVVAVVQLRPGSAPVRRGAARGGRRAPGRATRHPGRSCGSTRIDRSPSGKPDYRWAAEVASSSV